MKRASYFTKRFTGSGVRVVNEFSASQQFLRLNQMNRLVHGIEWGKNEDRAGVVVAKVRETRTQKETGRETEEKTHDPLERNFGISSRQIFGPTSAPMTLTIVTILSTA